MKAAQCNQISHSKFHCALIKNEFYIITEHRKLDEIIKIIRNDHKVLNIATAIAQGPIFPHLLIVLVLVLVLVTCTTSTSTSHKYKYNYK